MQACREACEVPDRNLNALTLVISPLNHRSIIPAELSHMQCPTGWTSSAGVVGGSVVAPGSEDIKLDVTTGSEMGHGSPELRWTLRREAACVISEGGVSHAQARRTRARPSQLRERVKMSVDTERLGPAKLRSSAFVDLHHGELARFATGRPQ